MLHAPGVRAILTTDALVFEAMLFTLAAPLAGVAIASGRAPLGRTCAALAAALGGFFGASLLLQVWASPPGAAELGALMQGRAAAVATALALAAMGALLVTWRDNVLDAAAISVLVAIVAAGGLIAAGPATSELPGAVINAGLLVSPVIATTASAHIDLLRGAELYRFSPLAHRRFEYPAWSSVAVCYLCVAGCCLAGVARELRRDRPPQAA